MRSPGAGVRRPAGVIVLVDVSQNAHHQIESPGPGAVQVRVSGGESRCNASSRVPVYSYVFPLAVVYVAPDVIEVIRNL